MTTPCPHANLYWYPAINEEGWKCADCGTKPGEPPGYSPQHDRSHMYVKVDNILQELVTAQLVHVSNSSAGEWITSEVMKVCIVAGTFDQYSILKAILDLPDMTESHAKFWKEIGEGVITGNDPRARCECGALAEIYSGKDARRCRGCWSKDMQP